MELKLMQTKEKGIKSYILTLKNDCTFIFRLSPEIGSRLISKFTQLGLRKIIVDDFPGLTTCIIPGSMEGSSGEANSHSVDAKQKTKMTRCAEDAKTAGGTGVLGRELITYYTCPTGLNACNSCSSKSCKDEICTEASSRHQTFDAWMERTFGPR
jgi:hypothetical protein